MPLRWEMRATHVGRWLLAFVVPGSALAIGSLIPWVLVVTSSLAAIACALLWLEPAQRSSRAIPWALAAFTLLVVATALQAVPLPASLGSLIAPTNADVWERALGPFGEAAPRFHPLTVAPPATHLELLKGLLYSCIFLGALRVALSDGGSIFLERLVIVSACLVAFSTLGHPASQADKVFGIYRPREGFGYMPGRIGPLLNPNHVSAYLNVGASVATGAIFGRRRSMPRPLAIGTVVLLAGTSVWAGSRGGMGSLVVGALLVGGLAIQQRRRHPTLFGRAEIAITVGGLIAAAVLLGLGSSDPARSEVAGRDLSKLDIIWSATPLITRVPFFGVGRGAYETMYPLVRQDTAYYTFIAPENVVIQWMAEWGVPVAVAAFVLFAIAIRPNVVLGAARPAIGAWVAIVIVTLHDLVDFHLEVPGVVVLVVVCLAIIVSSRATGSEPERTPRRLAMPRILAFGASAATVGAIALVVPDADHSLRDDRDHFAQIALDPNVLSDQFRRELRAAILRYPAEPYFPLMGAVHAQRIGEESIIPWIARALERYPRFGRAHLVLARTLARNYRPQARLEYRLAYSYDMYLHRTINKEAPFLVDGLTSALELIPEGAYGAPFLESLSQSLSTRLPATSTQLDDEILRRDPNAKGPHKRRARAALSDLANHHPWCDDRVQCAESAISSAEALVKHDAEMCEPRVLLTELRIQAGEPSRALDELTGALDQLQGKQSQVCLHELVRLSLANKDSRHADMALSRALRAGCGTREECLALYSWAAGVEEKRGNVAGAIAFWKRVSEQSPESDRSFEHIGELAAKIGLYQEGIDAYRTLAQRHPENPKWKAKADELRAKSMQQRPLPVTTAPRPLGP